MTTDAEIVPLYATVLRQQFVPLYREVTCHAGVAFTHTSTLLQVPSPLDAAARDVTLELSGTGSEEYASAQTLKHWDSCVSGASYRTAQEQLTASNSLTRLPTPRGQAISESRERWSGARDDLINAGTYPRPANPAPVGGTHIPNPPPGQQQLQRLPSPHRNSGRGLGAGTIPAPYMDGTNANLPARYANLRTNSSRRGSARMTPPASPYANPSDPRSPHGRGADPMSTGNLSGPLSGRAMSGRGLFPAYDGMLAGHMQSGENPSKSIEMMPGMYRLAYSGSSRLLSLSLTPMSTEPGVVCFLLCKILKKYS